MYGSVPCCALKEPDSYSFPGREGKEPTNILDPFALKETVVLLGSIFFFNIHFSHKVLEMSKGLFFKSPPLAPESPTVEGGLQLCCQPSMPPPPPGTAAELVQVPPVHVGYF